jgi:peptide/nickel transport system substrate-binding protein
MFKEYTAGQKLIQVRNPSYFKKDAQGRTLPYMDTIEQFRITDIAGEYAALRTGQIYMNSPFGGDRLAERQLTR